MRRSGFQSRSLRWLKFAFVPGFLALPVAGGSIISAAPTWLRPKGATAMDGTAWFTYAPTGAPVLINRYYCTLMSGLGSSGAVIKDGI